MACIFPTIANSRPLGEYHRALLSTDIISYLTGPHVHLHKLYVFLSPRRPQLFCVALLANPCAPRDNFMRTDLALDSLERALIAPAWARQQVPPLKSSRIPAHFHLLQRERDLPRRQPISGQQKQPLRKSTSRGHKRSLQRWLHQPPPPPEDQRDPGIRHAGMNIIKQLSFVAMH